MYYITGAQWNRYQDGLVSEPCFDWSLERLHVTDQRHTPNSIPPGYDLLYHTLPSLNSKKFTPCWVPYLVGSTFARQEKPLFPINELEQ